jgi:hypothetical protein
MATDIAPKGGYAPIPFDVADADFGEHPFYAVG